jgi:Leucine-rich repeat (LRR) protein
MWFPLLNQPMKNLLLFLLLFGTLVSFAQEEISLGPCDSLPVDFYENIDLKILNVYNGKETYCSVCYEKFLDDRIANFQNLEELSYNHGLSSGEGSFFPLPYEIGKLKNIKVLRTNVFSKEAYSLVNLEYLAISIDGNSMDNGVYDFSSFTHLESLIIEVSRGDNSATFRGLSKLSNLKYVSVQYGSKVIVDSVLANPYVEILDLQFCIGEEYDFSRSVGLRSLSMRSCEFETIPVSLYKLDSIASLDISSAQLNEISEEIGQLKNLTRLSLSGNGASSLRKISSGISELSKLESLSISGFPNLKKLPEGMNKLNNLEGLTLFSNGLEVLPKSLESCLSLRGVVIGDNKFNDMEFDFSKLLKLELLAMTDCDLRTVPLSIFNLSSLTRLVLSRNRLTSFPEDIDKLINLEQLDISHNQITKLPIEISTLPKLKHLKVEFNNL